MKTLTKMFLLSCWCLLSVSFAKEHIDQIKANQEQQIIQQKLEALEQENTQVKKEKISEEADCEESSGPILIKVPEATKEIPVPNYSNDGQEKPSSNLNLKENYKLQQKTQKEIPAIEKSYPFELEEAAKERAYYNDKKLATEKLEVEKAAKERAYYNDKKFFH